MVKTNKAILTNKDFIVNKHEKIIVVLSSFNSYCQCFIFQHAICWSMFISNYRDVPGFYQQNKKDEKFFSISRKTTLDYKHSSIWELDSTSGTFPASPGILFEFFFQWNKKDNKFFSISIENTLHYSIQINKTLILF